MLAIILTISRYVFLSKGSSEFSKNIRSPKVSFIVMLMYVWNWKHKEVLRFQLIRHCTATATGLGNIYLLYFPCKCCIRPLIAGKPTYLFHKQYDHRSIYVTVRYILVLYIYLKNQNLRYKYICTYFWHFTVLLPDLSWWCIIIQN